MRLDKLISNSNKNTFESKNVVTYYSSLKYLYKPEEKILNTYKIQLADMKMLDIGIGGGRTTYYFANFVREYIGIDYSENMIKTCKKHFSDLGNASFHLCDAGSMDIFKDNFFDFILFSYNGIDSVSHEDRLKILSEINRVCKKGGIFCFSSHNLQSIDKLLQIKFSLNPIKIAKRIIKYYLLKIINGDFQKLKRNNYVIMNDGLHRFKIRQYYIKPEEQLKQLSAAGFKNTKLYFLENGEEIKDQSQLNTVMDNWIYYSCNI
jgi:ubiquinone/menaquinone biosynthesis C-methylase UbiE